MATMTFVTQFLAPSSPEPVPQQFEERHRQDGDGPVQLTRVVGFEDGGIGTVAVLVDMGE
jgi:hypothetical protein